MAERLKFRQAVISIFKFDEASNALSKTPTLEIPFRQPFNNFGLGYSFNLLKTNFAPVTTAEVTILNMSDAQVDQFEFNTKTYRKRPLIQIRGGYSDFQQQSDADINILKGDLSLLYEGYPTFVSDDKVVGGRKFTLKLTDISAAGRTRRVSKMYRIGTQVITMLKDLAKLAKIKADFTKLEFDVAFVSKLLKKDLYFNRRQILLQVFPQLRRSFKISYTVDSTGTYVFRRTSIKGPVGVLQPVNAENGLIEHPTSINWAHYKVKTFFGLPEVFSENDWMLVESPVFDGGKIEALIVEVAYKFDDESAACEYVVSPTGQPVNGNPILSI